MYKIIILFFLFGYLSTIYCQRTILDYYGGQKYSQSEKTSNTDYNAGDEDCFCDSSNSCDEFCCCDNDCLEDAKKYWRARSKCIDKQDSVGIFADRCIDSNLVFRKNKRRGLKYENQTEDVITKHSKTEITNYCFSMDNSGKMKKKIESLNQLNNININETLLETIAEFVYKKEFPENNNDGKEKASNSNETINKYIELSNDTINIFKKSNYFSLFSGTNCENRNNVEFFNPVNYTCLIDNNNMNNIINEANLDKILIKNNETSEINCHLFKAYHIDENGLLNINSSNKSCNNNIVEVEFLIKMNSKMLEVNDCLYNIICSNNSKTKYLFKNSIKFIQQNYSGNLSYLPYRYSGNGGYLKNYPLKISFINSSNNIVTPNEFFVVGRDHDGNCRTDNDISDYLYGSDIPIYFKQDFSYSCYLNNTRIKDTTLYKKINNITSIGKYGSSSYKNNNSTYWEKISQQNNTNNTTSIIMNVYIGTNKIGLHKYKYIFKTHIAFPEVLYSEKNDTLLFKVNYIDLEDDEDNESKYKKKPSPPIFIPKLPEDFLDPLIESKVDK